MFTGVFGAPVTWLVAGSVDWYMNVAGRLIKSERPHPVAITEPTWIIVAKAVAVVPTCTERLDGSTAATKANDCTALSASARPAPKAKSNPAAPRSVAGAWGAP